MKKSELKQIIKEEYQKMNKNNKSILTEESLITKILYMFLAPKVKKDINKLKKTPEYKEYEQQAKIAVDNLEQISDRLSRVHRAQEDAIDAASKVGIKYRPGMTYDEIMALQPGLTKKLQTYKSTLKK
jgi:hypothetical protein